MKLSEGRRIAQELADARQAHTTALDRLNRALRAYQALPLSFEPDDCDTPLEGLK